MKILLLALLSFSAIADDNLVDSIGTPNFHFIDKLIDNRADFQSEFFKRVPLYSHELKIDDTLTRDYFFPTQYDDVTTMTAMFACSYEKAKALMPDPSMLPLDLEFGRSVVIVTSFRYNKVIGIPAYNEVAVSIPIGIGKKPKITDFPKFSDGSTDGLGFYVASMPVTSLENQIRGTHLWGLPKVVQEIDLLVDKEKDRYTTVVKQEDGTEYLRVVVPTVGTSLDVDEKTNLYSILAGKVVKSESHTKGSFVVMSSLPDGWATIALGNSPSAQLLRNLQIADPTPMSVRFGRHVSSTFDLPKAQAVGAASP